MTAAIVGERAAALRPLLSDALSDVGLEFDDGDSSQIDVLLALITPDNVVHILSGAMRRKPRAPIIAILSVGDERLAKTAIELGAEACHALDTSLNLLKFLLLAVAVDATRAVVADLARAAIVRPFRLGARARDLLAELQASDETYPGHAVGKNAASRIERAIRLDIEERIAHHAGRKYPYQMGVRARLEVSLMRLSSAQIGRLERAIEADLTTEDDRT